MKKQKSGISLIVLVITIIVIIILAVAVILSIANNNPIENANKAKFQNDLKTIQEELTLKQSSNYIDEHTGKTVEDITINSLSSAANYTGKLTIQNQKLYISSDLQGTKEEEWANEVGITVAPIEYVKLDLSKATSSSNAEDGLYVEGNILKGKYTGTEANIEISEGISKIDEQVFQGKSELQSVKLPEGIESIGNWGFLGCVNLESVTIPSTVKTMGTSVFQNCTALKNVTIAEGVKSIGSSATFAECKSLRSITIPSTVESISAGMFENCTALKNVTISNGLKYIDDALVFGGCTSLESITIPSSVSYIGTETFSKCTNLKEIKLLGEYTSTGSFGNGDDAWFWTGLAEENCVIKVKHENVKTLIEGAGYTGTIIVDTNLS